MKKEKPKKSKIIQIAVAGQYNGTLYALDSDGHVWILQPGTGWCLVKGSKVFQAREI